MTWKKLLHEGKIQKKSISIKEVDQVFARAQKSLRSAEFLLEQYEESAFKLAYDAMLIAGRSFNIWKASRRSMEYRAFFFYIKICKLFNIHSIIFDRIELFG